MSRTPKLVALLAAAAVGLTGCSSGSSDSGASNEGGVTTLELWTHNGGNPTELAVNKKVVDAFNASQSKYKVKLQSFPQASYNDAVTAAASAKKLPCVMDIDGPNVPNWAWAGYLQPLDLGAGFFDKQLPSTLGKVDDKVYSFGHYDVAMSLIARKSVLTQNGIRIPTLDQPWTGDEFDAAVGKIKAGGKFAFPLDMGTAGTGEWIPYAYSPLLQSFGGDLVNRETYQSATGVLNGPEALEWASWFRGLITKGYAQQKSGKDSTVDFVNGKSAIMWNGSWAADAVTKKFGADVVFLPPPDFGKGPKIGGASWQWGMSSSCAAKDGALEYLKFSAKPEYYVDYATALGLIPANTDAAAQVPNFAPGGKYRFFLELSQKHALVRPVTPAYPFIASTFQKAVSDILAGGDAQKILDKAAKDIDNNIKSNGNYEF
ncbi:multiple sugar transport system substrate-binding protein [Kribbella sp. VKM Ac-2527]|uniref:Multiple sugar transport system substrate-binding protein n=1 Tax=Kribbella caucasensis TaxID=2512215 RepID=A0A4R6JJA1_9ACTN|nr:sugar ABC transporter substrate-binding protein [Kribbella sp. VKM Ac-2527]TDO35221.1 multiple sugar transport system substrate-binding protein [Kribbella sp. VKM Ac-2527]